MTNPRRGHWLTLSAENIEASGFAQKHLARVIDPAKPDPRWVNLVRQTWVLETVPGCELEAIFSDSGEAEVVSLAIPRAVLRELSTAGRVVTLWAEFLAEALGALSPSEQNTLGSLLAVNHDVLRVFEPLTARLGFVPRDGAGGAIEVFLGRRVEATARFATGQATLIVRNDERARLLTLVATQRAVFDLGSLLTQAPVRFAGGEHGSLLGWLAAEVESTAFGRRFGLDFDRMSPPKGRIARRFFSFSRLARTAKIEVLTSPGRGIAAVWLKIDQRWVEESETNFFAALELVGAFLAGCVGDPPDPRALDTVAGFFSCGEDDGDLFAVLKRELPGARQGECGRGLAVFLGESECESVTLDEGNVGLMVHEGGDGWLDVVLYRSDKAQDIGEPLGKFLGATTENSGE